jgi:hypothetical protein
MSATPELRNSSFVDFFLDSRTNRARNSFTCLIPLAINCGEVAYPAMSQAGAFPPPNWRSDGERAIGIVLGGFGFAGVGPVYGPISFTPGPPFQDPNFFFAFVTPYTFLSAGNMDPNTANSFHLALHFTAAGTAVPEPASVSMLGIGVVGLLTGARRARKQART